MHQSPPLPHFPVALNLEGRTCVVVGARDDGEAVEKARDLEACGARVRRITDPSALRDEDVADAFFVISTPIDEALSRRLRALSDRHGFLLCCIDQPAYGFVAMQATADAGPVRIAISTAGVSPALGKQIRLALSQAMDAKFLRFLECLRALRGLNRRWRDSSSERRAVMRAAVEGFDLTVDMTYPQWFEDELQGMRPQVLKKGTHGVR
jgi:siroheme synthase (precorrin-2 oxidase/ferrochelatase)